MAQDLIDKIREQAQARGLDPEVAVRIAQVESSLDPSAKAKTSSAQGLFQVVDKTWKDFGGKPGQKNNPDENIRVGLNILESNTKSLKNALGRDPSPTELYAAHFLGAQGAKTVLSANPDTPVSELLSQRAIKANPTMLKDKSARELIAVLDAKMGMPQSRTTAQAAPVQAPMPAPAAGAPKRAAAPAAQPLKQAAATGDLGAGYQAALALSFLGDEEQEGQPLSREEWQAREDDRTAAQMLADYKPKNALAQINWDESSLFPVKMAGGGEVAKLAAGGLPYVPTATIRPSYKAQLLAAEGDSARYNKEADAYNEAAQAYNDNPYATVRPTYDHRILYKSDGQTYQGDFVVNGMRINDYLASVGSPTRVTPGQYREQGLLYGQDFQYERPFTSQEPVAPSMTQEQYDALVNKARKDAANRNTALQVAANPEAFGLSMAKLFAEGGEVKEPSLIAVPGYSEKVAYEMYPGQQGQFDQQDAARHMLAAGTLARKYGPGTAEFLGKAHEIVTSPGKWIGSKLGIAEMPVDYEQDMHNNRLGIELARRSRSQKELEDLIQAEAERAQREQRPGSAWIGRPQRPVKRAEGSPEAGEVAALTPEEIAAASRPAFRTSRSGIGRNITLTSGQVNDATLQGIAETPYNLVGAPVDVAAMVMRPFGYTNPTPTMGSDWIKQQMTRLGVRPEAPTQPTARALYEMGQFGGAMVNPAAPVRAAAAAVERAAPVIREAAAAAAPVARSTAAQMLEKVRDVPVGMSIKPVEPIFRSMPTEEAPFVGRLDEFVASMQTPVRKEQFLGQLKGKFREYDINRAEEVLADLPANAKLTPSDLLNRLKSRYDPANMRVTVIEPEQAGSFFGGQDNIYKSQPVGVLHLSRFVDPARAERIDNLKELAPAFSSARTVLDQYPEVAIKGLDQLRVDPVAAAKVDQITQLREQIFAHRKPWNEGKAALNILLYPSFDPQFLQKHDQYFLPEYRRLLAQGVPDDQAGKAASDFVLDILRQPAREKLTELFGSAPQNDTELVKAMLNRYGPDWLTVNSRLEKQIQETTDSLRRYVLSNEDKFNVASPYVGKHTSLRPPADSVQFSRFVEHTVQDPQRGRLKGIYLPEIQSDLTSELKAGRSELKDKQVFPNMAENRRTVQQLGIKTAISAAIGRGDQFVAFPGKESAKAKLYESLGDNLKQVAKDLGPGFEIRPFTLKDAEGTEMQHLGITWGPEAAERVMKKGVPFKDGGLVERRPDDSRKYL